MKKLFALFFIAALVANIAVAQVAVNTTGSSADGSAMLDVSSTTKGFLPPRVALTGTSAASPLAAHVAGMVVYNTATVSNVTPGLYTNNGTAWVPLVNVPYTGATGDVTLGTNKINLAGLIAYSNPFTILYNNLNRLSIDATNTTLFSGNGGVYLGVNNNYVYAHGNFLPSIVDINLGATDARWTQIFSVDNINVSSDARLKENILPLGDKYVQFIRHLNPVEFDWITNKNGKHMGVTVQQTEQAMTDAGLNAADYCIINKENPDAYGMSPDQLIAPLIKYTQNLEKELNDLKALLKAKGIIE